jgi:hypothetical protein
MPHANTGEGPQRQLVVFEIDMYYSNYENRGKAMLNLALGREKVYNR